jgi:hypothetical protein
VTRAQKEALDTVLRALDHRIVANEDFRTMREMLEALGVVERQCQTVRQRCTPKPCL